MRRSAPAVLLLVLVSCGNSATTKPTPSTTRSTSAAPITSATTTALPLGRSGAAMAYDPVRHNAVLFGGVADQTFLDDTWTWDGTSWTHRQGLTQSPRARQGAASAYDVATKTVVLFGGYTADGPQGDTWSWDGAAWQQLHPAHSPEAREDATATYDSLLGAVVLYGGIAGIGQSQPLTETWSWNGTDWTQLNVSGPAGGTRPRTAYLIGANLLERFGDCSAGNDSTVYGFDGNTWVPKSTSGSPPPALCRPSLAGNTNRREIVLFGGKPSPAATPIPADTWIYDGDVWHKPAPIPSPPARDDGAMVYDSDLQVMLLFGGQGLNPGQSGPLNDTWTWDGSSWTQHQ